MIKKLELENPDFLDNLTLKDKKAVQKAIKLYYDYLDCELLRHKWRSFLTNNFQRN